MREELERIRQVLEELLGRPSRWSGVLELTSDPAINGAKPFRCDIILNVALTDQDVRWRTLIHEMLHTFSAGYRPQEYVEFRGWEEGVVEQLQRLLRPTVLARLGLDITEETFHAVEQHHEYQEYIAALEQVRPYLSHDPAAFYCGLLAIPIKGRRQFVWEQVMALPPEQRLVPARTLSRIDSILKKGKTS